MVKCVSLLGSTGSIGRQSLDIISRMPEIRVCALTAGTSVERMAQQCREFLPELRCRLQDPLQFFGLHRPCGIVFAAGLTGLCNLYKIHFSLPFLHFQKFFFSPLYLKKLK